MNLVEWISQPWPWYVSGPLIALVMFGLIMEGKSLGMSANLRTICTMSGAGKYSDFFCFDWKRDRWNLMVLMGAIFGGFIASYFLNANAPVILAQDTINALSEMGFNDAGSAFLPEKIFGLSSTSAIVLMILGGFLVGFGARYAGGCTSGHAITGLSHLQWPSLIAVVGFFIGGLVMTHVLFPFIF